MRYSVLRVAVVLPVVDTVRTLGSEKKPVEDFLEYFVLIRPPIGHSVGVLVEEMYQYQSKESKNTYLVDECMVLQEII